MGPLSKGVTLEGINTIKVFSRFIRHVDRSAGDCWIWTGALAAGYGRFGMGRIPGSKVPRYKTVGAHQFAWMLANGDIPVGMLVCHDCDNKRCVRPSHLFLGTDQDNVDDMLSKQRHDSKLTSDQVLIVMELLAKGKIGYLGISKMFDVTKGDIAHIAQGRSWTHVTGLPKVAR